MSDFQFYPTPLALAQKAWSLFKNRNFTRVLETSAGNGDLIRGARDFDDDRGRGIKVDCCELDMSKHATLRSLPGVTVVGMDYMQFGGGAAYGHVIQNPPFATGVKFVLRAWDNMFDGEIVSIIGAETIRNPNSRERQHLLQLIEQHGSVEFIQSAFVGEDVERETEVEVALVYLRKKSEVGYDIVSSLLKDMSRDDAEMKAGRVAADYQEAYEVAVPASAVENFVMVFDMAVKAMSAAVIAEARSSHYSAMIGRTMSELTSDSKIESEANTSTDWVRSTIASRYEGLKDRAWANLLLSSKVESLLSSEAQKRMKAEFDNIKNFEFTSQNINGFLRGLEENQGDILRQMACDVFDLITRYHEDNVVFYKGWVSNSKQRTCGMRLKKSRFVIPRNTSWTGSDSLSCEAIQRLGDLDKVLAMLDGKKQPDVSLVDVFRTRGAELRSGSREAGSYMEVRFYPRAGTIHFFPRSQELMDRLNVLVGQQRQWLPPATEAPSEDFMRQFEDADRFDKELRTEIDIFMRGKPSHKTDFDRPTRQIFRTDEKERGAAAIDEALTKVHARHGISVDFLLQHQAEAEKQGQLLLAA